MSREGAGTCILNLTCPVIPYLQIDMEYTRANFLMNCELGAEAAGARACISRWSQEAQHKRAHWWLVMDRKAPSEPPFGALSTSKI